MSTGIVRVGDKCSGHGKHPPRVAIEGSPNVFIGGVPVVRVGDKWAVHCAGPACHDGVGVGGSSKVFVNGKPVMRFGDDISCGSVAAQGSDTVFGG